MQRLTDKVTTSEIPRTQRRPLAKPLSHNRDIYPDPKAAMVAAYATGDYTMQTIADFFGVHYATVRRTIRKGEGA